MRRLRHRRNNSKKQINIVKLLKGFAMIDRSFEGLLADYGYDYGCGWKKQLNKINRHPGKMGTSKHITRS